MGDVNEAVKKVRRAKAQLRRSGRILEGERLAPVERDEVLISIDDVLDEARRQRARLRR